MITEVIVARVLIGLDTRLRELYQHYDDSTKSERLITTSRLSRAVRLYESWKASTANSGTIEINGSEDEIKEATRILDFYLSKKKALETGERITW